ncbi:MULTISPECIES: prepilin peptidase [Halanaerobium]|jgi:leader peptidase (prepilin peptidase)/N-methyltransferase|uniref:Prepilin leader peptidase/N-methyltransferase n=1 Tax=Halanaerobium congolense TaxID=54121 RepID=A0A1G9P6A8_9FIRM|nr:MULTISPECIES: A24 family peptidase [Halanaerobium]PTX16995.1 leader peptidase (prepilin peptidase)/N-methyltransferase [Halanaerobium congolense]PUU89177.1 MAG: leader peptidase (prepilin peptidase) / N-methyltransferase [Halanaerobium sp.]PUU90169.1 MAG: leader peptidase (prepilin peptidase) / N-methyltransferase [Halanaerobium sp.]PXV61158.1 leader peptidase (prepilin peptidase)/N-methyltransferase [Halanaerobium congolense]SDE66697.1 leader peptidase (prepilin peptidase) / N-methyltransf
MIFLLFITGLVIGSFLNVVIYRLPTGKSIIYPPSHCPNCGHKLSMLELIPVLSYIFLRGKCKNCKADISIRYPIIELLTGIIFIINYIYISDLIILAAGLVFSSLMIVLTMIDVDHQILPDQLTLGGLVVGLSFSFFRTDITFIYSLIGVLAAGGLLFLIAFLSKGGMGGGDIKMMAMVGSFTGPVIAVTAVFLGALIALMAHLPGVISGKTGMKTKLPFGPFLAVASLILWFYSEELFAMYLSLIF